MYVNTEEIGWMNVLICVGEREIISVDSCVDFPNRSAKGLN
jgi:hypothetical protein